MNLKYRLILLLSLIIINVFACQKSKTYVHENIRELTDHLSTETKELVNCRLAMGKILAQLIEENGEVKAFIIDEIYEDGVPANELIVAKYLDTVFLRDGSTLRQLIASRAKGINDVRSLYEGESIFDCFEVDPLLTIACPKIFQNLMVNIPSGVQPGLYVDAASSLTEGEYIGYNFFFHGTGFQTTANHWTYPDYLGFSLKLSEDYLLIQPDLRVTHKQIPIELLFPQMEDNWNGFFDWTNESSHPIMDDYLIVSKQSISKYYHNHVKKPYTFVDLNACQKECKRECFEPGKITDVILDIKIRDNYGLLQFVDKSMVFQEKMSLIIHIFDSGNNPAFLVQKHIVHNIDPFKLLNYSNSLAVDPEKGKYELLGRITLPKLKGKFKWENSVHSHDLGIPFSREWDPKISGISKNINFQIVHFRDKVDECRIRYDGFNPNANTTMPCSEYYEIANRLLHFCDQPFGYYDSGEIEFSIGF